MSVLDKFKNLFKTGESGFKVSGNHWFARYSNTFKDRENEYFTKKSIDGFIDRVDTGVTPAPELWVYHMPIVVGKAYSVFRVDNFICAVGEFSASPLGQAAKAYLSSNKAKLSHGFTFNPTTFKDNTYHDYNTFEISILPFAKNVEANAYTNIEVKDMSLTPEKEQLLKDMFGEDTAKQLIADTEKASKSLEDAGVAFKDFTDIEAIKMDKDPDKKKPTDGDEDEDTGDEKSIKSLYVDLVGDMSEVADGQNIVAQALKQIKQQNSDIQTEQRKLKQAFQDATDTYEKTLEALKQENETLRKELALTPKRASDSVNTQLDPKDDANKSLADAIAEKESSETDTFWN